jgi:transcription initiation factor TFIIIB Brf1 subunit/transcription initiation factor TFIIB
MPKHPLKNRVEECYIELYRKHVLTTLGLEEKATAVVYYVLKENRTPVPLKELREEFSCNTRTLNRAIKRINKHYNSPKKDGADPTYMLKRITSKITLDLEFASKCQEVLEVFESITKDIDCVKGTVYYASICWIAKNMFLHPIKQKDIARKAKVSISSIKLTTKKLLALIGYENCSQIKGKQVNEIRRN